MDKREPKKSRVVISPAVVSMMGMMGPYWYEELVEVATMLGHGDDSAED